GRGCGGARSLPGFRIGQVDEFPAVANEATWETGQVRAEEGDGGPLAGQSHLQGEGRVRVAAACMAEAGFGAGRALPRRGTHPARGNTFSQGRVSPSRGAVPG